MKIQVLGSGCSTCKKLYELTSQAVQELKIPSTVEYVTDVQKIIEMGVMQSPVLAVDGKPVIVGYLPKIDAIKKALTSQTKNDCSCQSGSSCCGGNCS